MVNRFTTWALVLGLGLLPVAAQPPGNSRGGADQGQRMDRMAKQLELTEDQKAQIQTIQTRHGAAIKAKAKSQVPAQKAFREAAQNPDTPPAQLKALYLAKSDLAFELMLERRTKQHEIRAILTPNQRMELDKLQAYRHGVKEGRRGKGGHGKG